METAAYWVALVTVVAFPPPMLLWLVVHPFTHKWRELGPARTYLILSAILVSMMVGIFLFRERLLRIHFGVRWPLAALAILLFLAASYMKIRVHRHLTVATMFGLPQLSAREYPGKLVTSGIYAHVRHPRYLEAGLGLASMALFSNYLAVYVLLAVCFPVMYLVVLVEERELKERFGEEYEQYCLDVPRFVPRLFRSRRLENT